MTPCTTPLCPNTCVCLAVTESSFWSPSSCQSMYYVLYCAVHGFSSCMETSAAAWGPWQLHGDLGSCMGTLAAAWGPWQLHGDLGSCMETSAAAWGPQQLHGDLSSCLGPQQLFGTLAAVWDLGSCLGPQQLRGDLGSCVGSQQLCSHLAVDGTPSDCFHCCGLCSVHHTKETTPHVCVTLLQRTQQNLTRRRFLKWSWPTL